MKFALLGADPDALELVRMLVGRGEHELVWVCEAEAFGGQLRGLAPHAARDDHWESLLHGGIAEVVVVARGDDEPLRADQLRKLAQAAMPLVMIHPACESIICYELEMIRHDTGCVMVAYFPGGFHSAIPRLADMATGGPDAVVGAVEQLVFERQMPERSRPLVEAQFARDVALMRMILGDLNKVGAMGPAGDEAVYSNLSVHMDGPAGILARWSVGPAEGGAGGRILLLGSHSKATLTMPGGGDWRLEIDGREAAEETFARENPTKTLIEALSAPPEGCPAPLDWNDACRAVETADALHRSLRRGRTIDLYDIDLSEEETFKGVMAIGGCGLLVVALVLLLAGAFIGGIAQGGDDANHILRLWPIFLVSPLVIFLALQLLKLVYWKKTRKSTPASDEDDRET